MQEFTCKITDNYKMLLNFTSKKNIFFSEKINYHDVYTIDWKWF